MEGPFGILPLHGLLSVSASPTEVLFLKLASVAIISGPTAPPGGQCRSSQPQLRSRSPQSRGTIQVLSGFLL